MPAPVVEQVYSRIYIMYITGGLTLAELESLAGLGLAGFLALYGTWVACHEAFLAQCALVLGVDFDEGTCDSEAQSLGLSLVAATLEVDGDVILFNCLQGVERLLNDELEDRVGEVLGERALVNFDFAVAFVYINACDSCFAATYCINSIHSSLLFQFVDVNCFGRLGLVWVVLAVIDVHVLQKLCSKLGFGEHTLDYLEV